MATIGSVFRNTFSSGRPRALCKNTVPRKTKLKVLYADVHWTRKIFFTNLPIVVRTLKGILSEKKQ